MAKLSYQEKLNQVMAEFEAAAGVIKRWEEPMQWNEKDHHMAIKFLNLRESKWLSRGIYNTNILSINGVSLDDKVECILSDAYNYVYRSKMNEDFLAAKKTFEVFLAKVEELKTKYSEKLQNCNNSYKSTIFSEFLAEMETPYITMVFMCADYLFRTDSGLYQAKLSEIKTGGEFFGLCTGRPNELLVQQMATVDEQEAVVAPVVQEVAQSKPKGNKMKQMKKQIKKLKKRVDMLENIIFGYDLFCHDRDFNVIPMDWLLTETQDLETMNTFVPIQSHKPAFQTSEGKSVENQSYAIGMSVLNGMPDLDVFKGDGAPVKSLHEFKGEEIDNVNKALMSASNAVKQDSKEWHMSPEEKERYAKTQQRFAQNRFTGACPDLSQIPLYKGNQGAQHPDFPNQNATAGNSANQHWQPEQPVQGGYATVRPRLTGYQSPFFPNQGQHPQGDVSGIFASGDSISRLYQDATADSSTSPHFNQMNKSGFAFKTGLENIDVESANWLLGSTNCLKSPKDYIGKMEECFKINAAMCSQRENIAMVSVLDLVRMMFSCLGDTLLQTVHEFRENPYHYVSKVMERLNDYMVKENDFHLKGQDIHRHTMSEIIHLSSNFLRNAKAISFNESKYHNEQMLLLFILYVAVSLNYYNDIALKNGRTETVTDLVLKHMR